MGGAGRAPDPVMTHDQPQLAGDAQPRTALRVEGAAFNQQRQLAPTANGRERRLLA
jgi:hypothetical protein